MTRNLSLLLAVFGASAVLATSGAIAATNTNVDGSTILAREASEGPRGADNERPGDRQRRGGRGVIEEQQQNILAREASEAPRGSDNERPGDRQRRGGRVIEDQQPNVLAREASEGPRGADNERPGDHQRRGGRG